MNDVLRKTEIGAIDGTPEKRMFWSIISDYDLKTGLCELVDNALDLWVQGGKKKPLRIEIRLNTDRQLITVVDNAGGVKQEDLRLLVAPGGSRNAPEDEVIGIFGVGSKRAGVALGEQVIVKTRSGRQQTYEIDITKEWLTSESWELASYEIPSIEPGTTQVEISHLRKSFSEDHLEGIQLHLEETYAWFFQQGCVIQVNDVTLKPRHFETWAFPPGFVPRSATFDVDLGKDGRISVDMTAGLIRDRVPEESNYGVYFYCNHRLIVKELKTREVGYFVASEAGVPHTDASLCRVIVRLQGPAKLMPWNSSKSGINFDHIAFQQVRATLIRMASHFSSLSRRLKEDWERNVFRHKTGAIEKVDPEGVLPGKRLVLPPLPRVNRARAEKLKARNKTQIRNMPWTLGLVEAIAAVDIITRQRIETKNRIALILLDSNFEIALKEFVVHRTDLFPPREFDNTAIQKLFERRSDVIKAVTSKIAIPKTLIDKTQHYYNLRNKLIHERATVGITDSDVANYRATMEEILSILFQLRF